MVDLEGFEPSTSSMPWRRAPNCATGPLARFKDSIALRLLESSVLRRPRMLGTTVPSWVEYGQVDSKSIGGLAIDVKAKVPTTLGEVSHRPCAQVAQNWWV